MLRSPNIVLLVGVIFPQVLINLSYASDWSMLGDHNKLKSHTIVDIGKISKMSPPYGTTWDVDLFEINSRCLSITGYNKPTFSSSTAAMLLIDSSEAIRVAIFENSISIDVKVFPVTLYKCPYGATLDEKLESALRQYENSQKELNKQLEALKKQKEEYEHLQEKLKKDN